ncbi:MAG: glycosyltransferase [Balneolaceae bacterium]
MIEPSTLFWLLSVSLVYLLATSVILLRNRFEFSPLRSETTDTEPFPKISICIPARNEEASLPRLLESVCRQDYPTFEVLVLDDFSEDKTHEVIQQYRNTFPGRVVPIEASPKPDHWLGKPWACRQLANNATGDILLFLDADTVLFPGMLNNIAGAFKRHKLDMITVWPQQQLVTFWEKTVIPLIYYALLTLLPSIYVYRKPRWMPAFLAKWLAPSFAAANGQCIGFTQEAYEEIGGHDAVKQKVVEDVALAKVARKKGLSLRMFNGTASIRCRMYHSQQELYNGLRKNFFAGFNRSIPLFLVMALLHLVVFVLPFVAIFLPFVWQQPSLVFLSVSSVSLILLHRFILAVWFRWNPIYGLLHPLGVLWFQRLGIRSVADHLSGKKVKWKGREV